MKSGRSMGLTLMVVCLGCGGAQGPAAPAASAPETAPANVVSTPERAAESSPKAAPTAPEIACPAPGDPAEAQREYEQGMALVAQSRDGDHYLREPYEKAMALLESAARKGHVESQARYGALQFGNMMTNDAPQPKEEEDYVRAMKWLRVAALRGSASAKSYVPGLTSMALDDEGKLAKPVEQPLDQFDPAWLRRVILESDAWMECEGAR